MGIVVLLLPAIGLKMIFDWSLSNDQKLKLHITFLFPDINGMTNKELFMKVRKLAVEEWLENSNVYQAF